MGCTIMERGQISWFGIDFGTTNSAACSMTGVSLKQIEAYEHGDDSGFPFPSVVAIHKETGEVLTGREAKNQRNQLSEDYHFFTSVKSVIDKNESYEIAGNNWTPVDIAAEIFKGLKVNIEKKASNCKDAIIAVPIGFSPEKKANVRKAAKLAGINIKMFVSEPTAAFRSNYDALKMCSNVAVFDWGGGTLDVAILHIEGGRVYETETDGISIAGDDLNKKIAEKMHAKFCKKKGIEASFEEMDNVAKDMLLVKSEQAKILLSEGEDIATVSVLKYGDYGVLRETIDYDFFSQLVEPEVDQAIGCLEDTIKKAGLNISNIDRILCVGGSSKLKPLKDKLIDIYGEDLVYYPKSVMFDIARGAALINLTGGRYGLNQDLGLIMSNGEFYPMIKKGQPLPCQEAKMYFATVNDEKVAKFIVTDSEKPEKSSFQKYITIESEDAGLMSEMYEVSCFVDPDMLFRFRIRSSRFQHRYLCLWTYDKVKVFYKLGGIDEQ